MDEPTLEQRVHELERFREEVAAASAQAENGEISHYNALKIIRAALQQVNKTKTYLRKPRRSRAAY